MTTVTPNIAQVCSPVGVSEGPAFPHERIRVIGLMGAVLLISPIDCGIRIYRADGRLAFWGRLGQGENRISLERGVYIWMAGGQKGKIAVPE